ncbi:MAG: hypothetical protein ACRCUE_14915 [Bosea sp. (in: a-proteobacteria)]
MSAYLASGIDGHMKMRILIRKQGRDDDVNSPTRNGVQGHIGQPASMRMV